VVFMIDKEELIRIVQNFKNSHVLVLGDVMLDIYEDGDVDRISPEAPVPIIHIKKEKHILGGAANSANNIASFGAKVTCMGVVGDDEHGSKLDSLFANIDVDSLLIAEPDRRTTTKTRIMSRQQIVRIDKEDTHQISEVTEKKIIEAIKSMDFNAVVLSDYAKGTLSKNICRNIIEISNARKIPVIIDPRPSNTEFYSGAFLITPNHKEACQMSGVLENNGPELGSVGPRLQAMLDSHILITRGAKGMTLYEKGSEEKHIPTKSQEVIDVTGAGDTVASTIGLALASGANLHQASIIANYAAGIVVGKLGTSTCTRDELISAIRDDVE